MDPFFLSDSENFKKKYTTLTKVFFTVLYPVVRLQSLTKIGERWSRLDTARVEPAPVVQADTSIKQELVSEPSLKLWHRMLAPLPSPRNQKPARFCHRFLGSRLPS